MHNNKHQRGLTLIELLVGIAILGLLTSFAIPSFQRTIERNQTAALANDLLSTFLLARSEAIKREQRVVVRSSRSWQQRWLVYSDTDRNGGFNPSRGDQLLAHVIPEHPAVQIVPHGRLQRRLTYTPSGRSLVPLNPGADYFELKRGQAVRYLCFTALGRPRIRREVCS